MQSKKDENQREMLAVEIDLNKIRNFGIADYLGREFECECGKKHSVDIEKIIIEKGALKKIPEILRNYIAKKIFMVADRNTYHAAGERVEQLLSDSGFAYKTMLYEREGDLVPDERAIGEFFINIEKDTDIILAVGSGVINDLSKYISARLNIPLIIVATAPSMDGYASDTSALTLDNLKTSVAVKLPKVIIGDLDVLKEAPLEMILAGFGDMIGKYSALKDWKLGKILTGEYYCETVAEMVKLSVQKCIDNINGYKSKDVDAIKNLMEGLVVSGIAMSFVENSRPASGTEHHISHYWETMFLLENKKAVLHGIKVGIAALASSNIAAVLTSRNIDFETVENKAGSFDENKWKNEIIKFYRKAAPGILKLSEKHDRNSLEARKQRVNVIKLNWRLIVNTLQEGPSPAQVDNMLNQAGAVRNPRDIGISNDIIYNSIVYAKEIRTRYTVLQLLWDLSLIEEFAQVVTDYYKALSEKA